MGKNIENIKRKTKPVWLLLYKVKFTAALTRTHIHSTDRRPIHLKQIKNTSILCWTLYIVYTNDLCLHSYRNMRSLSAPCRFISMCWLPRRRDSIESVRKRKLCVMPKMNLRMRSSDSMVVRHLHVDWQQRTRTSKLQCIQSNQRQRIYVFFASLSFLLHCYWASF